MKYRLGVKNELIYLFLISAITKFFSYSILKVELEVLLLLGFLGLVLLETWFIRTFCLYSGKKISRYSDVIMRISLKERFFSYFILPSIFYISLLFFLYYNRNSILGDTVLGVSMVLFLILFLNVKSSLNKVYSLEISTRAIFDFICITIFYLLLNTSIRLGMSFETFGILTFAFSAILLCFVLKIHEKLGFIEIIVSIVSSLFISMITLCFWDHNLFVIPAMGTLSFYLVISLWNIRFAGRIKLLDYLIPFLYVALATVLILTL